MLALAGTNRVPMSAFDEASLETFEPEKKHKRVWGQFGNPGVTVGWVGKVAHVCHLLSDANTNYNGKEAMPLKL